MEAEYAAIVKEFRHLTRYVGASGRCCDDVRDGSPRCCYRLVDGEELEFTEREARLLSDGPMDRGKFVAFMGRVLLNRDVWHGERMAESLRSGWLADTLECASHPTRPIVLADERGLPRVVGVALVLDCNRKVGWARYLRTRRNLMALWQRAIDLTGMKTYYVTEWVGDGLAVL